MVLCFVTILIALSLAAELPTATDTDAVERPEVPTPPPRIGSHEQPIDSIIVLIESPGMTGTGSYMMDRHGRRGILTNNHVLGSRDAAKQASVRFGCNKQVYGSDFAVRLDPDNFFFTDKNLDYTFVALTSAAIRELSRKSEATRTPIMDAGSVVGTHQDGRFDPRHLLEEHCDRVKVGEFVQQWGHARGELLTILPNKRVWQVGSIVKGSDSSRKGPTFAFGPAEVVGGCSGSPVFKGMVLVGLEWGSNSAERVGLAIHIQPILRSINEHHAPSAAPFTVEDYVEVTQDYTAESSGLLTEGMVGQIRTLTSSETGVKFRGFPEAKTVHRLHFRKLRKIDVPTVPRFTVTGAGATEANDVYVENGQENGKPMYSNGKCKILWSQDGDWRIVTEVTDAAPERTLYVSRLDTSLPPTEDWTAEGQTGEAPAPFTTGRRNVTIQSQQTGLDFDQIPSGQADFSGEVRLLGVRDPQLKHLRVQPGSRLLKVNQLEVSGLSGSQISAAIKHARKSSAEYQLHLMPDKAICPKGHSLKVLAITPGSWSCDSCGQSVPEQHIMACWGDVSDSSTRCSWGLASCCCPLAPRTSRCPKGHELEKFDVQVPQGGRHNAGHSCDRCTRVAITAPEHTFRCRECDFDLCKECYLSEPIAAATVAASTAAAVATAVAVAHSLPPVHADPLTTVGSEQEEPDTTVSLRAEVARLRSALAQSEAARTGGADNHEVAGGDEPTTQRPA